MMKQGCSLTEVAADLDVSRETLYDWKKNKKAFSDTKKKGERLSQAWWEKKGRENLENRNFQTGLWFANMKNRFYRDWRDKHDMAHSGDLQSQIQRFTPPPDEK